MFVLCYSRLLFWRIFYGHNARESHLGLYDGILNLVISVRMEMLQL